MGHFQSISTRLSAIFGLEKPHIGIKKPDAFSISLFAVTTENLHPNTNAQQGFAKLANSLYKTAVPEIGHSLGSIAHSGEKHFVRSGKAGRV